MSDSFTELQTKSEVTPGSSNGSADAGFDFQGRYGELIGRLNTVLDSLDWNLMSKAAKAIGIVLAVVVLQILIKGVLDTINILPVVPGLLELLGLVIVIRWSWQNLSTSDKRSAVFSRMQTLRQEYLG